MIRRRTRVSVAVQALCEGQRTLVYLCSLPGDFHRLPERFNRFSKSDQSPVRPLHSKTSQGCMMKRKKVRGQVSSPSRSARGPAGYPAATKRKCRIVLLKQLADLRIRQPGHVPEGVLYVLLSQAT
jgi:hypothetical protein